MNDQSDKSDKFDDDLPSAESPSAEFPSAELPSAEFLSAYVDGELTGEQLALVEQRLVDDPQAHQLVEELRSIRREVQSLPKETIGEDLRATIMQRAERSMLLGADEHQTLRQSNSDAARRWTWAAMAMAATLLLMAFLPHDPLEEKPLASVKPAVGDKPRGELRIEAVESEPATADADAVLEAVAAAPVEERLADRTSETEAATAFRSGAVMSPPAVASREILFDEIQPAFQVHITLNEGANRFENFNRLLISNGIELEDAEAEADADGPSGQQDQAAGVRFSAKSRQIRQLLKSQQRVQEEVLLVEASAESIESVLKECSSDLLNCAAVRVEAEEKSTVLPIDNLGQYERSGKQLAVNQQNYLKREKPASKRTQRGRAMRLQADQYASQPDGQLTIEQKLLTKNTLAAKKSSNSPVQVLFILQQALGESASAGRDR